MADWPPPVDDDTTQNSPVIDSEAVAEDEVDKTYFATDEATHIHVAIPVEVSSDEPQSSDQPPPVSLPPAAVPNPRRKRPRPANSSPPWWIFLIIIAVVLVITGGIWGFVLLGNTNSVAVSGGPTPTPIFVVITATHTPEAIEPTLAPAQPAVEQPAITATPPPQSIAVGGTVIVTGTEQAGLSVRGGAGVGFPILFIAVDGETFTVIAGPTDADGFTWWNISDPADSARVGWAASAFLLVSP